MELPTSQAAVKSNKAIHLDVIAPHKPRIGFIGFMIKLGIEGCMLFVNGMDEFLIGLQRIEVAGPTVPVKQHTIAKAELIASRYNNRTRLAARERISAERVHRHKSSIA